MPAAETNNPKYQWLNTIKAYFLPKSHPLLFTVILSSSRATEFSPLESLHVVGQQMENEKESIGFLKAMPRSGCITSIPISLARLGIWTYLTARKDEK